MHSCFTSYAEGRYRVAVVDTDPEQLGARMRIDGTKNVIEQVDITILIHSTSQLNALFLPAAKIHTSLSDLSLITKFHLSQIRFQGTLLYNPLVQSSIHGSSKQDILLDCPILDPRLLSYISCAPADSHLLNIQNQGFIIVLVSCYKALLQFYKKEKWIALCSPSHEHEPVHVSYTHPFNTDGNT